VPTWRSSLSTTLHFSNTSSRHKNKSKITFGIVFRFDSADKLSNYISFNTQQGFPFSNQELTE
jgi:hypothetical protein